MKYIKHIKIQKYVKTDVAIRLLCPLYCLWKFSISTLYIIFNNFMFQSFYTDEMLEIRKTYENQTWIYRALEDCRVIKFITHINNK